MQHHPLLSSLAGYWAGRFQPAPATATFDVRDPADGARLATLPMLGAAETSQAISATQPVLAAPPPLESRIDWLGRIAGLLVRERESLARIITAENGKPLGEALAEVDYSAGFYRDAATRVPDLRVQRLPDRARDHLWEVHHRPAGVAGLITPWNFPLGMLAKKLSGALAAGCPSVVKPAEKTPLSCIAFFALLDELGLPPGMCNLVFGNAPEIGGVLCRDPAVRVISFTGSTAVGKLLARQCAPHVKRLSMELGGNAPFLVFADADIDNAVTHLMANKFRCAGQTCVCTNRVYVQASAVAAFTAKLTERVKALRVGPGMEAGTDIGPLIDAAGFGKVRSLVADAIGKGATPTCGGLPAADESRFFAPTVLSGVTPDMSCTREELFGPVVPISTFEHEADAVRLANASEYGLAAYVFAGDVGAARTIAGRLQFGHVGVNSATGPIAGAPFGGMKQSGIGREGGLEGVLEFVELQTIPTPE